MLPRLPRCIFQRPLGHLKCMDPLRITSIGVRTSESAFVVAIPRSINSKLFHGYSRLDLYGGQKTVRKSCSCRSKSTKPQQNPISSLDGAEENVEKESSKEIVESNEGSSEVESSKKQSTAQLTISKRDGEEESKRRYEKEDPPEEERHKYHKKRPERSINKALMRTDYFDNMKTKSKKNFAFAIELFEERDVHMRGHVEFIYAALKEMKRFGVHKDLDAYKKIIDVFPKGRMIQTNMFQVEFMHFPKQQQCAIDVLEQMEDHGVIPDSEVQQMLTNIFGTWSFPMRKASRMLYWMPKFKNLSPWLLPETLPDGSLELAKIAVERMTSVDLTSKISVYDCTELEDASDLTWIVSGQSLDQQKLIESLPSDRPIYVEGAFRVWLRDTCMNYFILRSDAKLPPKDESNEDDVGNLHSVFEEEYIDKALQTVPTVHEQEDGCILGVCCTGTSSRDSVVSWIRFLEQTNPRLGKDVSVLFTLKSPIGPTDDLEILTYQDIDELKKLGKPRDPFTSASDELGLDPGMPDMRQLGVWTDSESKFPNWPHSFHNPDSISLKNRLENERVLKQMEKRKMSEPDKIDSSSSNDEKGKPYDEKRQLE